MKEILCAHVGMALCIGSTTSTISYYNHMLKKYYW